MPDAEAGEGGNPHPFVVAALYQFVALPDFDTLREPLLAVAQAHGLRGTVLLAAEGINGTVAGDRAGIDAVLAHLRADPRLAGLQHKESTAARQPFHRLKVRLKQEIVTMGVPDIDPGASAGTYVEPEDWNELISDPEVLLVDTRNDYEVAIGSFRGAVNPGTRSFREFPAYADTALAGHRQKKIAMFCTGGIRCEKATSYLQDQGFEQVYHLRGGILKYLETVPEQESLWRGECYVFDERVSVDHQLRPGHAVQCEACGEPLTREEQASEAFEADISCPHCIDSLTPQRRAALEMRRDQRRAARG